MRYRYRLRLWWLGQDSLSRLSYLCIVVLVVCYTLVILWW